jgi:DNA-binding NarL/FixJ family response regulator
MSIAAINSGSENTSYTKLTPREREVLRLASTGLPSKSIGERLGVKTRTVTFHLGSVYNKYGVHTREAAILQAILHGEIPEFTLNEPLVVAPAKLTRRELEVLELMDHGLTSREIGRMLQISERTAQFHTDHIYEKLSAHNRRTALLRARSHGLLRPRTLVRPGMIGHPNQSFGMSSPNKT